MTTSSYLVLVLIELYRLTIAHGKTFNLIGAEPLPAHCIPNDIVFVCIELNSITSLSYSTAHRIYALVSLSYIDPTLSEATQSIHSKTTTSTSVHDLYPLVCVPTFQSNVISVSQYSVTLRNRADNNTKIGTLLINNLNNHIFKISDVALNQLPIEVSFDATPYFDSTLITSSVRTALSIWITNQQCIQIKYGDMFAKDEYMLSATLYHASNYTNRIMFASQATTSEYGKVSWNDAYICLPQSQSNPESALYGIFKLYSTTQLSGNNSDSIEYVIAAINSDTELNEYQQCQRNSNKTNSSDTINFAIGDVVITSLTTCDYAGFQCDDIWSDDDNTNDNANIDVFRLIQTYYLELSIFIFVLILLFVGFVMAFIAHYVTNKWYVSADPVKYDYIVFLVISLWSAVSQFSLLLYLFHCVTTEPNQVFVKYLLCGCGVLFAASYIANTVAMIHYLQIWSHALAPGTTRHWLEFWSWALIMLCVLFGNVNVAVELCNCLLIPTVDIFAMHLPRSQIVNSRINRFWSNAVLLDFPYFVSICVYLGAVDTDIITIKSFIIVNTLVICLLSFILTVSFAYSRRSYSSKCPIALYRFSFTFKSSGFESYFIHSHRRIKQSFAELMSLRKNSLVIIDQCSEILGCMKVEGRILKDTKKEWDSLQMKALQKNVQQNSAKLETILAQQFMTHSDNVTVTVEHFQFVRMRDINGQLVYDYDTDIKRLFECQTCCAYDSSDENNDNNTASK